MEARFKPGDMVKMIIVSPQGYDPVMIVCSPGYKYSDGAIWYHCKWLDVRCRLQNGQIPEYALREYKKGN